MLNSTHLERKQYSQNSKGISETLCKCHRDMSWNSNGGQKQGGKQKRTIEKLTRNGQKVKTEKVEGGKGG